MNQNQFNLHSFVFSMPVGITVSEGAKSPKPKINLCIYWHLIGMVIQIVIQVKVPTHTNKARPLVHERI